MNSLALMAMNAIQNRPDMRDDPIAKELVEIIRTGDDARGERLAMELCEKNGDTPQTAMTKVKAFFSNKSQK